MDACTDRHDCDDIAIESLSISCGADGRERCRGPLFLTVSFRDNSDFHFVRNLNKLRTSEELMSALSNGSFWTAGGIRRV